MRAVHALIAGLLMGAAAVVHAQGWSPQKNVEIIASSVPGGSNDKTARTMEHVLLTKKLLSATLTVVNKAGGGGNIAYTYLSQHPGDAHYLGIATDGLLSNHILGASTLNYPDFTPIALLFNDYTVIAVNASSPIKTGKDLIERLRKDPQSVSIGFANAFGSTRHISVGLLMKAIGGNPRNLKTIVFKGSAEAIVALLGGHIDVVSIGATNATVHVAGGNMRVIAAAAPQRFGGTLAGAPTWKEQGVDLVAGSWRGIVGPKGLSAAQTAYWEGLLRKMTETPEWKADLEKNYWSSDFMPSAQFRKELEKDYGGTKTVLVELGLAKQ
jgi:putative tricarboxylic transport membrane protein